MIKLDKKNLRVIILLRIFLSRMACEVDQGGRMCNSLTLREQDDAMAAQGFVHRYEEEIPDPALDEQNRRYYDYLDKSFTAAGYLTAEGRAFNADGTIKSGFVYIYYN